MSQETERKQGIFVIAAFDRMFTRERKNQDGTFSKTHYVGLIIRSEAQTRLCEVRTKHPEKYEGYKPQQIVSMQVSLVHSKTTSIIQTKHKPVIAVRRLPLYRPQPSRLLST